MKPADELVALTPDAEVAARRLGCASEFVVSWRIRERLLPDGRRILEPGWEPSAGFIAAALAILRAHN